MTVITLDTVSLDINFGGRRQSVLRHASYAVPVARMALIGESRSNVVALLDLFSRRLIPQSGQVRFGGRVSWPIGHTAPFSVAITGTQAVSHLATLYDFDRELALAFLRAEMDEPEQISRAIASWPRLRQTRFMMLLALIPQFDVYLVDGNLIMTEDIAFTRRFLQMFLTRTRGCTLLITARQVRLLRLMCTEAVVLRDGKLETMQDLEAALALSNRVPTVQTADFQRDDDLSDNDFMF